MAATEYSLSQAFKRIEEELIKSMIRNFEKHKAEELEEGFNWDQWQVVQLRELEKYRQKNKEKFDEEFTDLNSQIEELLRMTNQDAQTKEEAKILDQIRKGLFFDTSDPGIDAGVFAVNDAKLDTLIESTTRDLEKAEHAVLRRSNDIYRRAIYDAQVYAAEGGTYEQAVDMATEDFVKRGIQSVVYKNGSRHNIRDYASMAIRTANKRAYLLGEGKKHAQYGIHTVRVAKREGACPLCIRWVGKVLIDDVYGGGTKQEAREKRLPLLSTAMAKGFLHPNCKDIYSLYIEGVSKPADPWSEYELKVLADKYNQEEGMKHAEIMAGKWRLVADTRLDKENRAQAEARFREWQEKIKDYSGGIEADDETLDIDLKPYEDFEESLKSFGIQAIPIEPLAAPLTEEELIRKLAQKDPTRGGSCSSVALAYVGNKMGYDVKDFRGGKSKDWFSRRGWKVQALKEWFGLKGEYIETRNELATVQGMLKRIIADKEYYLAAGQHASIICKDSATDRFLYLDLQEKLDRAGWKPLTEEALINRFGCENNNKNKAVPCIISVDSLIKSDELKRLLPYLNTL